MAKQSLRNITITDTDYREWIRNLSVRYRNSQIKAAVNVNSEMLQFYWSLGRDIVKYGLDNKYGSHFYSILSKDLQAELPDVSGLSERNIRYMKDFYLLYSQNNPNLPQVVAELDPYNFAFTCIRGKYNETLLKDALLKNITEFLVELGTGFAYVGKEYRLQIGTKEKFIDLLFFHIPLNCYVVIEVKIGEFDAPDVGQLGTYVVACNHILKQESHNPTIGLLICKNKDNLLAQYALESSNQPIGISEFELEKLYPTEVEGMIPTIEEIEDKLADRMAKENIKEGN